MQALYLERPPLPQEFLSEAASAILPEARTPLQPMPAEPTGGLPSLSETRWDSDLKEISPFSNSRARTKVPKQLPKQQEVRDVGGLFYLNDLFCLIYSPAPVHAYTRAR